MSTEQSHNCGDGEEKLISDVNTFGWHVLMIEATEYLPSFAYTVGLWKNYDHPEIISFGLTVKTLHLALNDIGAAIKNGTTYNPYTNIPDIFENSPVQLIPVDKRNIKDYFGYAIWFNKTVDFPAMQMVWTDRNDRFPWEEGYEDEFIYRQPLLDRNADFKFKEAKNLGVFTTRQWLEQNKPVIRVLHDDDGDWQFLTGNQMPEDIRLVCLEDMTRRDSTLNDVFNLDFGEEADRVAIGEEWERRTSTPED